jgi:hypothetical protein
VLLTELPAGHDFEPISFSIDAEKSRAYREATGDALPIYDASSNVPPLAVAAVALGALLERVDLPPGTLHANESASFKLAVPVAARLDCRARLVQRSQRGGWVVSVLETEIQLKGDTAVQARATVLCPAS